MSDIKKDFPILQNNKGIVYLDSTATAQKPSYVIDWIKKFLENDYSNIHRWAYSIAERSEDLYVKSKKKMAEFINAENWREIIYSHNSTYASNLLIWSLRRSWIFKRWDKVLLTIVEHHANIVPWLILKEEIWIEVDYIKVKEDFSLDFEDLEKKFDEKVRTLSITHVSNVTWEIFDVEKIWKIINEKTEIFRNSNENYKKPIFIVDGSQSVPSFKVDVQKIGCDAMFTTGHKFMANSGIGVLWGKQDLLDKLEPVFSWGGAIASVAKSCFKPAGLPDKFEPGTPNMTGAVSLLRALEYIENIWGYEKIQEIKKELENYALEKFAKYDKIKLIGSTNSANRVWVFSFTVDWIHSHDIADYLADYNICIRAWQHCAEPFMWELWINHSCRASLYIYNTKEDIDKLFEALEGAMEELG